MRMKTLLPMLTENSTTSDNDGKFTIKYANGSLVSIGGTDLDSQTLLRQPFNHSQT